MNDSGNDSSGMKASGTYSTSSSPSYGFNENESSSDNFVLNKTMPGSMNGVGTVTQSLVTSMSGSTSGGAFSSTQSVTISNSETQSGSVTYSGVTTGFAALNTHFEVQSVGITGPTAVTTTATLTNTVTASGALDGADMTEMRAAGQGSTAGTQVAGQIGGSPDGGPDQELARVGNLIAGGNENPTSTQPGATPRAEQNPLRRVP